MLELERKLAEAGARVEGDWSDARIDRVAQAMARRGRRRSALRATGAALAIVLAGAAGLWAWRAPTTIRFADGSTATLLDRRSEVRTVESSSGRVVAEVVRGGALFDVTHRPERRFRVEAGDTAVEVLGTRFVVERREGEVRVSVERGRVRALQGSREQILAAGNEAHFPSLTRPVDAPVATPPVAPPSVPEPVVPPSPIADEPSPGGPGSGIEGSPRPKHGAPASRPATVHAGKSSWTAPAEQGDFDKAYEELSKSGPHAVRDLPAELLLAADVTRLSHHPAEAVPLLERVVRDHAGDPRAPLAAFTLGRVLLDELGRPQQAAGAFAKARGLEPNGPLAADALAREVEAWSRAGDTARARAQAEDYLRRYPKGARSSSVRRFGGIE